MSRSPSFSPNLKCFKMNCFDDDSVQVLSKSVYDVDCSLACVYNKKTAVTLNGKYLFESVVPEVNGDATDNKTKLKKCMKDWKLPSGCDPEKEKDAMIAFMKTCKGLSKVLLSSANSRKKTLLKKIQFFEMERAVLIQTSWSKMNIL